jgi:hypothetical protein
MKNARALFTTNARRRTGVVFLSLLLGAPSMPRAATIAVGPGDDLQAKIDGAAGGDVLLLATGTYRGVRLAHRHFTVDRPLIIKAAPGARPLILGTNYGGYLGHLSDCSYIVFDGLTLENSNQPFYCTSIDHCLFLNLDIHNTGQEAIHLRGASHDIDIRNCRIYDTGHYRDQWCEGIYIGMGQPPFEAVENVWIEGNDIHHTGHAEGINLKSRSYHITIRGNKVHDIAPGTATQFNEAAISCEAADLTFRPGIDPDIWIERNEVYDVTFGRWANGIQASTMGAKIVHNHIHDCQQYGIEFNDYLNGPGVCLNWIYGNTFTNCAAGAVNPTTLPCRNADPGPNPNRPQTWYPSANPAAAAKR